MTVDKRLDTPGWINMGTGGRKHVYVLGTTRQSNALVERQEMYIFSSTNQSINQSFEA